MIALPDQILTHIFSFLPLVSIARTIQCSSQINHLSTDINMWLIGIANSVSVKFKCASAGWLQIVLHHFKHNRQALYDACKKGPPFLIMRVLIREGWILKEKTNVQNLVFQIFVATLNDDDVAFAYIIWNFPQLFLCCSGEQQFTNMICQLSPNNVALIYSEIPVYSSLGRYHSVEDLKHLMNDLCDDVCRRIPYTSDPVQVFNAREFVSAVHAGKLKYKNGNASKCPKIYNLVESSFWETRCLPTIV